LFYFTVFCSSSLASTIVYDQTIGGSYGTENNQFKYPQGIDVDSNGRVCVADNYNHRVQVFNSNKELLFTIGVTGTSGDDNSHLSYPYDCTFDSSGRIYVADYGNDRVQIYSNGGSYLYTIHNLGVWVHDIYDPRGVFVDKNGKIYITAECCVRIFNSDGSYVGYIGTNCDTPRVLGIGGPECGDDNNHFNNPRGIFVDNNGKIYVADTNNNRIQIFNSDKTLFNSIGTGSAGSTKYQFNNPYDVALDSDGRIYVADYGNYRVQIYNSDRTHFYQLSGSEDYSFRPTSVTLDDNDKIYVSDYFHNRVQIFHPIDEGEPYWNLSEASPSSPAIFDYRYYIFKVNWYDDESKIDTVKIEHDFYGYKRNDTVSKNDNEYYSSFYSLSPGTYSWRMYAMDVSENWASTPQWTYIVCKDGDKDGYSPDGGVCGAIDCNDYSNKIYSGATELCDGVDNDCDGSKDEVFPNLGLECYAGVGECRRTGYYVCSNDGLSTICNGVPGQPINEICDNKDNDCDGKVDENLIENRTCGTDIGECASGNQSRTCVNGIWNQWSQCNGNYIEPTDEICDNKDNDCDGITDENLIQSCGSDNCIGTQTCILGAWGGCSSFGRDCGVCASCDSFGKCIVYNNTQDYDCPDTTCSDACDLISDNNPFTWDYADDVPNECTGIFSCSNYLCSYNHQCSISNCGAECENDGNCGVNGWMCKGDIKSYRTFSCILNDCSCVHEDSNDYNCTQDNGWTDYVCKPGDVKYREYRDYSCSGGSCVHDVTDTDSSDCDSKDGWYTTDWIYQNNNCKKCKREELRDYYCYDGGCEYNVIGTREEICENINQGQICNTSDYECKDICNGGKREYTCQSGNCQFNQWVNLELCNPFECNLNKCSFVCSKSCGASCEVESDCPDTIIEDTHWKLSSCSENKTERVKTYEDKGCSFDCSCYSKGIQEEHVNWSCLKDNCGARCDSNEDCDGGYICNNNCVCELGLVQICPDPKEMTGPIQTTSCHTSCKSSKCNLSYEYCIYEWNPPSPCKSINKTIYPGDSALWMVCQSRGSCILKGKPLISGTTTTTLPPTGCDPICTQSTTACQVACKDIKCNSSYNYCIYEWNPPSPCKSTNVTILPGEKAPWMVCTSRGNCTMTACR